MMMAPCIGRPAHWPALRYLTPALYLGLVFALAMHGILGELEVLRRPLIPALPTIRDQIGSILTLDIDNEQEKFPQARPVMRSRRSRSYQSHAQTWVAVTSH